MRILLLTFALLGVAAQTTVEPPVLPPGQFCEHPVPGGPAPAHACSCHRECKDEDEYDVNGEPTGRTVTRVKEDAQCKQWCHADHCHCPLMNCD